MSSWCVLCEDRSLKLSAEVYPRLCCGVLVLGQVQVSSNEGAALETKEAAVRLKAKYEGLTPAAISGLAPARTLYKSFGMDPSRHRPSSEALLRRALKGKDLFHINSAVDSCNLASLDFLLPVGMYDLELIQGNVEVRVGLPGDSYAGIRKGQVNIGQRLSLYDEQGPFGSPTSDSARTCVEEKATRILAVIFGPAGYPELKMQENLTHFTDLFARHCAATTVIRECLGFGDDQ